MAKGDAIRAGRAFVELFADDHVLARGLKRALRRLRSFGTGVRRMGTRRTGLGAAFGGCPAEGRAVPAGWV